MKPLGNGLQNEKQNCKHVLHLTGQMHNLSPPDVVNTGKPETQGGVTKALEAHNPFSFDVFTFTLHILSTLSRKIRSLNHRCLTTVILTKQKKYFDQLHKPISKKFAETV